jgi:acyl dehydratase
MAANWRVAGLERRRHAAGTRFVLEAGDVVSAAPELARLTLNIASAHHDSRAGAGGRRLVYGGHTVGLAAAQVTRALPECLYIVAWRSCDHLGPVFEGDTLASEIDVVETQEATAVTVAELHVRVFAERDNGRHAVLDWRPIVLLT